MEQAFLPLDEWLKLVSYQQTTRKLERMVCEVGLRLPYHQAAEVLREVGGLATAGRQVEGIVDRQGQRAKAVRDADLIINRRCELRGMTWYRDTADGLCNLRALRFNGSQRWNAFRNS